MTPARATGFSASAITRCSGESVRSTPSSVTSVSPARARRTTIAGRPSGALRERVEVEGVQRLADVPEDVVRRVDRAS